MAEDLKDFQMQKGLEEKGNDREKNREPTNLGEDPQVAFYGDLR